jgi:four helix bundle protein
MVDKQFRFQDMEIWRRGAGVSRQLFALADRLDERRFYRFAEQFRSAALSITNNIAEGAGSTSAADFAHFLNMARRSLFEVVNMLVLFSEQGHWTRSEIDGIIRELEEQSRMLLAFRRTLKRMD